MEGYEVEQESVEEEKRRCGVEEEKCAERRKQRVVAATCWLYTPRRRLRVSEKESKL